MDSSRLPRFQRAPEIAPMRLTERDRQILAHIHRHRFLCSSHVLALVRGSRQQTLRRLQLLYHHGFLERPRCQIDYYYRGGSRPMAYGLGNKGAGLLKRQLALPYHRMQWPRKNRVERLFLEHALLISDFMVSLEIACRDRPNVRLLTEDDLSMMSQPGVLRSPFRWRVNVSGISKYGVIPDRVFGLEFKNGERRWFLLEADRGTMPVTRRNLNQSSFHRKLLAYEATWAQNLHRSLFGWQRFRVLTITTSSTRLAAIQAACHSLKRAHGLFLFGEASSLQAYKDVLLFRWLTARKGEIARMID